MSKTYLVVTGLRMILILNPKMIFILLNSSQILALVWAMFKEITNYLKFWGVSNYNVLPYLTQLFMIK